MKRPNLLLRSLWLGWFCCATAWLRADVKPNIIYILADDLGYGDLGCYGQKTIQTPHLDRLAQEGLRFTHFYAGSTVCGPSRCCLMTGKHTGHASVRGNANVGLTEQDTTIATLLKGQGYTTGHIGKWGLGEAGNAGIPNRQGFDYFFGYLNHQQAHNYYPEFLWRNEAKFPLPNQLDKTKTYQNEGAGVALARKAYSHDVLAADTLTWLREQKPERPFFLYLCFTIPHANNEAKPDGMEVPDYGPYEEKPWPAPEKGRAAMITRMDADIGKLLAVLKEKQWDEQTLIFFTSDNGPHREGGSDPAFHHSSGPLRGIKRDLYDGGIRVPMIARWPGKIKAATTTSVLSANWDILPTLCEVTVAKSPAALDGISLLSTLLGKAQTQTHEQLYWEFYEGQQAAQALRTPDWKAVYFFKQNRFELYAAADEAEATDVAAQHPEVVTKLKAALTAAHSPHPKLEWNP